MKTSEKDKATFKAKTHGLSDEEFIEVIRRYNDQHMFSGPVEREVSQDNIHINFLLQKLDSMVAKRSLGMAKLEDYLNENYTDPKFRLEVIKVFINFTK